MENEAAKAVESYEESTIHEKSVEDEKPEQKANFLQTVLDSGLPPQEKRRQRISQEAFSIIAAGGETVARTLTIATYHILTNTSILEKLRTELRTMQNDPWAPMEVRKLEHLPYLVSAYLLVTLMFARSCRLLMVF